MFQRIVNLMLIIGMLIAPVAVARTTGDPLDSNDVTTEVDGIFVEAGCGAWQIYPNCVPCMNACIRALIFEAMGDSILNGDGDWEAE